MNPAYSVILFTTASGAGYGLLFWLCLLQIAGIMPLTNWSYPVTLVLSLGLITMGLVSSTFHLGHPERAWRALSQWRSSWLSREGVAALATYAPAGALLGLSVLFPAASESHPAIVLTLSALSAIGAVVTVACTAMIYASLRTVAQWNMPLVPVVYLILAGASGLVLMSLCSTAFGDLSAPLGGLTIAALIAAGGIKAIYWHRIDTAAPKYSAAQAIGMGVDGVRQLDPPHTRPNFVMREMGYDVARRHGLRLRRIALLCITAGPALLILAALSLGGDAFFLILAGVVIALGLAVERWLFFAEATHVAMLFYGKPTA